MSEKIYFLGCIECPNCGNRSRLPAQGGFPVIPAGTKLDIDCPVSRHREYIVAHVPTSLAKEGKVFLVNTETGCCFGPPVLEPARLNDFFEEDGIVPYTVKIIEEGEPRC